MNHCFYFVIMKEIKMNTNNKHRLLLTIAIFCMFNDVSSAKFLMPTAAPIDRLLPNAAAYVKENPQNANGYYILARIHYLAFTNHTQQVNVFNEGKDSPPRVAENWQPQEPVKSDEMSMEQLMEHLTNAIDNFKKAIELDPKNGLYHLGLASLYEQYIDYVKKTDLKVLPDAFRNIILNRSAEIYYTAYQLSIEENLKVKMIPIAGLKSLSGYEAGKAYIRLVNADKSATDDQKNRAAEIVKNIDTLNKLPRGPITPIIFSLDNGLSAEELLSQNLQVKFDLDGDGNTELWPWVKPATGILVWNQGSNGSITSGRQMFGSVTWWLFFNDGYQALDCLDDNRDGVLTGSELNGIAVWFDINSNGQSEPDEIKSPDELEIVSISVKPTCTENNWPANKTGIKLKSGLNVATYDWLVKPRESL
jgi:hypothetical protein